MIKRSRVAAMLVLVALIASSAHAQTAFERTCYLDYGGGSAYVCRDHYGVPHIYATNEPALFYANGYATAEDRLYQLELFRRDAKGTLAALLGSSYIAHDQQVRRDGYTEAERLAQYDALPAHVKMIQESYRDGINTYLAKAIADPDNKGPKQFWDLGVIPAPWEVTDSVAIMIMMARRFGAAGGGELNNQAYLNANGWAAFNAWFPINDPTATTTIPNAEAPPPPTIAAKALKATAMPRNPYPQISPEVAQRMADEDAEFLRVLKELGLPTKLGSFADVVAPGKSATGNPMLLGAPQMGYDEPQISNEADLHAPGLDVAGMQFAGCPGILIGRNRDLAWSTTSGISDNVDLMVETLNPTNSHQYWYQGSWHDMAHRVETIAVAGGAPVYYDCYRTVHGPVRDWDLPNNLAFSLHATWWGDEKSSVLAFLDYDLAHNISEFEQGVTKIVTSHNFLCADRFGDIGYWHAGRYPLRAPGVDPRLPTSGEGDQEWVGFRAFADLPQLLNPLQGYFSNWNNKPVYWWDHGDIRYWIGTQRVQAIINLMAPDSSVTFDEMKLIPYHINDRGTYQQVVEVEDDVTLPAVNIVPPGQSGFIDKYGNYDPHFFDQKALYFGWDYKPFQFIPPETVAHHFAFDAIDPVQGGDANHPLPFAARIECRTFDDALASGYQGQAELSVPAGLTVDPPVVTFVDGVWSGELRIYGGPADDVAITSSDDYWQASGAGGSFRVAQKGDVNGDAAVNVLDVMKCVNLALGNPVSEPPRTEFQTWAADMPDAGGNVDGAINVLDVIRIVNQALGVTAATASASAAGPVEVSLAREHGNTWVVRVDHAAGVAGIQLDIAGARAQALAGELAATSGWQVYARPERRGLRVLAFSPTATGLTESRGILLRLTDVRGRPRLADVVLSDDRGRELLAQAATGGPGRGPADR
jgi:penicillin amidase